MLLFRVHYSMTTAADKPSISRPRVHYYICDRDLRVSMFSDRLYPGEERQLAVAELRILAQ